MSTVIAKGRHVLGKLSRNCDTRAPRDCEAALVWELRDNAGRPEFSAHGEVWNRLKTDIVRGGQCVAELAALFPHDALAQRIAAVHAAYHLNGMHAGTPEQSAALEAARAALAATLPPGPPLFFDDGTPNWYAVARHLGKGSAYELDCELLEKAGMLDVPVTDDLRASALGGLPEDATTYRYGTRWLYRAIPADVVDLIKRGFRDADTDAPDEGEHSADSDDAGDDDRDLIAEAGLTVTAVFVPWSQSRNRNERAPSLNWRVTLQCKGRDVLTCDYSAGCAHAPAYKNRALRGKPGVAAVWLECESGRAVKRLTSTGAAVYGAPIEPNARDVIRSLLLDADVLDAGCFIDWCAEYGFNEDSTSARKAYDECIAHAIAFRAAVGPEMFEALREANR